VSDDNFCDDTTSPKTPYESSMFYVTPSRPFSSFLKIFKIKETSFGVERGRGVGYFSKFRNKIAVD
jgi:hypothetical protein